MKEYFFVRSISPTPTYQCGYGMRATPKLYTKGSAVAIRNKLNKENSRGVRWEVVPAIITLGPALA